MALKFNQQKGSYQKDSYEMQDGENRVRLVGDILPRYVYWVAEGGKKLPMDCLGFNRNTEVFDNKVQDWVQEYYPDLRCGWAYVTTCIDLSDGKVKIFHLKKTLWEQIVKAAAELGDPTDFENGWDIVFDREKTGPKAFNVKYHLNVIACSKAKRALTDEERAAASEQPDLDERFPLPTAEEQKKALDGLRNPDEGGSAEVEKEFDDLD